MYIKQSISELWHKTLFKYFTMNSFFVLASAFLSFSLVSCMSHDDDYERPVDIKIGDGYHESDYYYEPEPDYYHDSKPTDDYYLPEHTDNPPQHTNYGCMSLVLITQYYI